MKMFELLEKPVSWTQGTPARDQIGCPVSCIAKDAVCWCLIGAAYLAYAETDRPLYDAILLRIRETCGEAIGKWNDAPERTHAEVLSLCRALDI